jgi:hypothetical protein
MTWRYEQASGRFYDDGGDLRAVGYSGALPNGKNNPAMQRVAQVGPIPCGTYTIEAPVDTVTHGPYVLELKPDPANEMFGRTHFLIHGDSVVNPGTASEGCIILPRTVREEVWRSGDHHLCVVAGPMAVPDLDGMISV